MNTTNYSVTPETDTVVLHGVPKPQHPFPIEEKKSITATLKSLAVDGFTSFPIERRSSVLTVANRLKKELVRLNWDYRLIDNTDDYTVTVVRVS